jgi:hypothetical protein
MAAVSPGRYQRAVKNYHELDSLLNCSGHKWQTNAVAESTPAVCTDAEMVDIFKASITTEVPNISENEKRLLHYFLNWWRTRECRAYLKISGESLVIHLLMEELRRTFK